MEKIRLIVKRELIHLTFKSYYVSVALISQKKKL